MKKIILFLAILGLTAGTALAAPIITYEELSTVADDHVVITWATTNETCNTEIEYGLLLPTTIATPETSLVTNHNCRLIDLYSSTTYYYRIRSTNAAGVTTYGNLKTFTTLTPPNGAYLFTFATLTDLQVATGLADTTGANGRLYSLSDKQLQAAVDFIDNYGTTYGLTYAPTFSIIKGNIIDVTSEAVAMALLATGKINTLTSTARPIPGNKDKTSTYSSGNWYTKNLGLIRTNAAASAESTKAAVYNDSFDQSGYHFIYLDSTSMTGTGTVDVTWLAADLAANTGKKSFIFLHNSVTDEAASTPVAVIETIAGTSEWNKIDLSNRSEFLDVLVTYKDNIVGVFSGNVYSNYSYYRNNESVYGHAPLDFPFVRTASVIQFPVGVNIYKVYSDGYEQLFYKASAGSSEAARGQITAEGYSTIYWQDAMLGSLSDRCFVHNYSNATLSPTIKTYIPSNSETGVVLNQEVILKFSKAMNTTIDVSSWFSSSPSKTFTYSWSSDSRTLTATPTSNFTASQSYTISLTGAAEASDGTFLVATSFSFTTGTSATSTAPTIHLDEIANDITSDNTPSFTGIATDSASTIVLIEYRINEGDWNAATALDGTFDSASEAYEFTISNELVRKQHTVELRATNSAGVTSTTFLTYQFYVAGNSPEIYLTSGGTDIINGDPIEASPSLEVTVICTNSLDKLYYSLDDQTRIDITPTNKGYINELFYEPTIGAGTHKILLEAIDNNGNISTKEANNLLVQTTGDPMLLGTPLPFPNPFNPDTGPAVISYTLSKSADVVISVHDIAGNVISKTTFTSGSVGGTAGYTEASWDGKDGSGNTVGNGIYIFLVIADGKVIGRGKVTVIK